MKCLPNTVINMRFLLRFFVALDFISLVLMGMQLWLIAHHFDQALKQPETLTALLKFPMFLLILIGGIGLLQFKKFGFMLYYIQFPFRFYLWVFSLGFITFFPELFGSYEDYWFDILLKVCMAAELVRLYFTIKAHIKLKNQQSQ